MVNKVMLRGLLIVLALALVGACSSSPRPSTRDFEPATAVVCDPCSPPGEPTEPLCPPDSTEWRCACDPDTALTMLNHILSLAEEAFAEGEIDQADLDLIVLHVPRCSAEGLVPLEEQPAACDRLRDIYDRARTDVVLDPPLPPGTDPEVVAAAKREASKGRWHTVATDLESFPAIPVNTRTD